MVKYQMNFTTCISSKHFIFVSICSISLRLLSNLVGWWDLFSHIFYEYLTDKNKLTGTISTRIGELRKLKQISLRKNQQTAMCSFVFLDMNMKTLNLKLFFLLYSTQRIINLMALSLPKWTNSMISEYLIYVSVECR